MSEKIDILAAQHGRTVNWHPVLLFAILRAHSLPAPIEHPIKLSYAIRDFERSGKFLGVKYRLPTNFPATTQHAARGYYLLRKLAPHVAVPFAQSAFRGFFSTGHDITDPNVVANMICDHTDALGLPDEVMSHLQSVEAKALLQAAIVNAVELKVFGSPFVIMDGESFFGVDRLPQIAAKLTAPD